MATIRKELTLNASPAEVWDVIRDVGAVHRRLAPGFVTDTRLEEGARVVTFANGVVARELIVSVEEDVQRLVWSVVGGRAGTARDDRGGLAGDSVNPGIVQRPRLDAARVPRRYSSANGVPAPQHCASVVVAHFITEWADG